MRIVELSWKRIFVSLFIIITLLSCKKEDGTLVEESKYREKNFTNRLYISSVKGDINVQGWNNDFIEIRSVKSLKDGLKTEINYLDLEFKRKGKELFINTRNPSLVEGRIDLDIYVPHSLRMIIIKAERGRININRYLWDLSLELNEGAVNCIFRGALFRLKGGDVRTDLSIKSQGVSDVTISNRKGITNVNLESSGGDTFLDIYAEMGQVYLNLLTDLKYNLFINYANPEVVFRRTLGTLISDGSGGKILETGNNGESSCRIFIKNSKGTIGFSGL